MKESLKSKDEENNNNNKKWFPLIKKKFKYLLEQDVLSLDKFLNDIEKQDSFFNQNSDDTTFTSLNSIINKDLLNFINKNKKDFISHLIDKVYSNQKFTYNINICSEIIMKQDFKSIYEQKLIHEFELLINNNEFTKIEYLTILIIGKSGVGKSTLINSLLKKDLAPTGVGFIVTEGDKFYKIDDIPFLNLIDTRGFELNQEFSPKRIYEEAQNTINKQIMENKENQKYNNYVQCIWYCVNESSLDEEELKLISRLKETEKSIPLIIVFTNAINIEEISKMQELIQDKFPNLPFIDVLGKSTKRKEKYGLDNLLNLTLEKCKSIEQGNIYDIIKEIFIKKVTDIFKQKFEDIKNNAYKISKDNFTSNFRQAKNEKEELIYYTCDLIEILFIEYMKDTGINKNESIMMKELNDENKNILKESIEFNKFTEDFICFYKNKVKEKINPILEKKAIEYLDLQVKVELEENKSINEMNKCDKKIFIENITTFLNNYFYYIAQKYYIYHFISDSFEFFSEEIERQINNIMNSFFSSDTAKDLFKNNYMKKFELFEGLIDKKRIDGYIYK